MREVRRVRAADTRPLRQAVLRPHQSIAEMAWPHDDAEDAAHFGAFVDGEMVATATVHREPPPGEDDPRAWRLRGMATAAGERGRGHGGALVEACLAWAGGRGATAVWCNARVAARAFYERHGFIVEGDRFDLPGIGPHLRMRRRV